MTGREAGTETLSPKRVLTAVLLVSTLIRLWLGYRYFGFHTGDDVEILQAGFMRTLDLPYTPWAIRNLFVSDALVAPVLSLASVIGVSSIKTLCWIATFPFVALASLNILLVHALSRRWLESPWAGVLAATLYAFHWLPLGMGSTVYPRTASTTCVLAAVLLVTTAGRGIKRPFAAGALVGVAFAIRYSEGIFLLPMLVPLIWDHEVTAQRIRVVAALGAGFAATTLVFVGLHDLATWGRPFSSLLEFARYTLIERQASARDPVQPWYWYLRRLPKWLPPTVLPIFFGQRGYGWLRLPLLYLGLPLIVLTMIHHKDLRYIQGVMPFVCIATAGAVHGWWQLGRRRATLVLIILSLGFGVAYPSFVKKKSMAAVVAVNALAEVPGLTRVALSQSWAYGGNLYLPREVELRELPFSPTVEDLERVVPGCQYVGLYRESLRTSPNLRLWLAENGYREHDSFEWGRSRAVEVYVGEGLKVEN